MALSVSSRFCNILPGLRSALGVLGLVASAAVATTAHGAATARGAASAQQPPAPISIADAPLPVHDDRSVFLSPFLPKARPATPLPSGAIEVEFLQDLVDLIPTGRAFNLVQFPLPDGTARDLQLREFSVTTDATTVVVMQKDATGEVVANDSFAPEGRLFQGRVVGAEDSLVYLAFSPTAISGFIRLDGRTYSISNGPRGEMATVISDLKALPEGAIDWTRYTCTVRPGGEPPEQGDGGVSSLPSCKMLEMAFETDNEYRALFASDQAAINYANQIAGGMNAIYMDQQNLYPVMTFVRVWSTGVTDPWSGADTEAQLNQFEAAWGGGGGPSGSNPRDLAHLISARSLGGGIAYLNAVCSPSLGFAVSAEITGFFPMPLQDNNPQNWDIIVTSHEMGHNCACNHTHELNPPIDGCGTNDCALASSGTIMSYCHLCPGGTANIALAFSTPNRAEMDAFLSGLACLSAPCPGADPSNFAASDGTFSDAVRLTWLAPGIAPLRLEIERRPLGGAFTLLNGNVSASATAFDDTTAAVGTVFEYRIRSIDMDGSPRAWVGPDTGFVGGSDNSQPWATVLEQSPDPQVVTSAALRNAITATGLPWRVRDNIAGVEMLLVPPGTYNMGCSASAAGQCFEDEVPNHTVTLTAAFYLGRYEVTQGEWTSVMGANPSFFQGAAFPAAEERPVEQVSWGTIQLFLAESGLRLPTEAEWEYAYRAGTTTAFHSMPGFPNGTNSDTQVGAIAWFNTNSENETTPVGFKAANALGLFDMSGNVWEWVKDFYGATYYASSPAQNPPGPASGEFRVMRGGSWFDSTDLLRSSYRDARAPSHADSATGFRVARTPNPPATPTIAAVSPSAGPLAGGTTITITGLNFSGVSAVKVGTTNATGIVVVNPNTITAVTPSGAAGAKSVSVTTPGGTATLNGGYTYVAAPTITAVAPANGPLGGGTTITITGTNFVGVTGVTVGGVAATGVTTLSPTSVTAVTPAGTVGAKNIVLTAAGGTVTRTSGFTYVAAPTITTVAPSSGPLAGGTTITITGTNLAGTTAVTVGGVAATSFTNVSATSVTAVTPARPAGAQSVTLTTAGGTATAAGAFTYVVAPTVTGVTPSMGPLAAGTAITVTGTNFTGATNLTIGGVAATNRTVVNATTITAVAPAGTAGAKPVVVTTPGGTGTLNNGYTYVAAPTITAVAPANGPLGGGTTITITGTNFIGVTGVTVGGVAATGVTTVSPTSVTAVTPAGTVGAKNIVLTAAGGTVTRTSGFTYVAAPTITTVAPSSGPLAGGTTITITGTNLAGTTAVSIGGVAATSFTNVSATSVTAVTPARPAGAQTVTLTTAGGTATSAGAFTYVVAPTVTGVTPSMGPLAAGTAITVTGTNFTGATNLTIGGAAATNRVVVNATTITANAPAGTAGAKPVVVTTPGGTGTLNNGYTYVAAPTITAVAPAKGPLGGGTTITITGTNFIGVTGVTVGGVAATGVTTVSPTSVTAVTPAGTVGAKNIVLTAAGGTVTRTNGFTYVAAPTITSFTPAQGPAAGGTTITITGTNLSGTTAVTVGGVNATSFTNVSATSVTAVTPARPAGAQSVTLTTAGGTATAATQFTAIPAPTVTGVTPSMGPLTAGTAITVTGTNFTGATNLTIGGVAATNRVVVNATTITAVAPAGTAGAKPVVVTTPGGTATLNSGYTYFAAPTITAVAPANGPLGGGTTITITGTNFIGVTGVTVGGNAATSVTVVSATSVTAVTPPGTAGAKNVVLTAVGGSVTRANGFTYVAVPTITSFTPAQGPAAGGTTITITGTNLAATTAVTVGGVAATSFTNVSATSVTAVTPARPAGAQSVTLTTAGGTATAATQFTAIPAPTVTSVTPSMGPLAAGTAITVTGTNFTGATNLTIGGVAVTNRTVVNATTITANAPAGTAGAKPVVVTTPGGTGTLNNGYTYVAAPTITAVAPASGPTAGGTTITITGTNFLGVTGVTVGGNAATSVTVVSATSVTAVTPPGTAGAKNVVLTAVGGSVTRTNGFTYVAPVPLISSLTPSIGPLSGGTAITVTGTNFTGATNLTIGGVAATNRVVVNATTITANAPAGTAGAKPVVVTTPGGTATLPSGFTYSNIWFTVLEQSPDASVVTNAALRNAIIATGLPWRVRDNNSQIEMLLVPAGTFSMGCSASNLQACGPMESPVHQVTLTNSFYIGRYEVTQGQWAGRMGSNPSYQQGSPNLPVESVSWTGIQGFLAATGLRLPTEAEWEYAYRAGTTTAFHSMPGFPNGTDDDTQVENIAWTSLNSSDMSHVVGQRAANGFGLHDMSGNVAECVSDWWSLNYYSSSPSTNPQGPTSGPFRVLRGGSMANESDALRSSYRGGVLPDMIATNVGFRVARNP